MAGDGADLWRRGDGSRRVMRKTRKIAAIASTGAVVFGAIGWFAWPQEEWVPGPMPDVEMNCFSEPQAPASSVCINRVVGSENRGVVYYFHGRNGAATWWNDRTYYT